MDIKVKLSREENIQHYGSTEITIDLEDYLFGVVPSEIGNANVEACAAQAIASRTYALNTIAGNGYITDKSSTHQAFRASRLTGYNNAYAGVEKTKGQTLFYGGKRAKCYYSSSNGGRTTSSKERWGGDFAYLISQHDEYDNGDGKGHGVGLSQLGAKNRAAAGQTYKEILDFYFPGTKIVQEVENMATNNEKKIINWLEERVGEGYAWGAGGYILTQSKLNELINQYPEYVSQSKNGKWLGKRVWDCAQLVRYAMKEVGISMVSGATSQWKKTSWLEKGTIDSIPKNKICCLYRQTNGTTMQHTGIYLGNDYFIDARGSSSGVLKAKLSSYKWTHWGIPKGLYTKDELKDTNTTIPQEVLKVLYKAKVVAESGSTVRMRSAASSSASTIVKVPIGEIVEVVAELEDWKQIVYNNETGYMMDEFLEKTEEAKPNEYYVKIKCASAAEAKRLAELLAGATAD